MRELIRRRVPQIVGAYLTTSWILLEFTDWAVDQYALSPILTNFVVTGLILLLPAVAVLAWWHGAPALLAEAGFELPFDVPLSLKRLMAEERSLKHFLEGEIDVDGDTLVMDTRLYETRNARRMAAHTYRGTDPLEMADRISVDLRRDLGVPEWQIEESVDLPAEELLTDSPDAFRAFSGLREPFYLNDLPAARAAAEEAVELDPTFARVGAPLCGFGSRGRGAG